MHQQKKYQLENNSKSPRFGMALGRVRAASYNSCTYSYNFYGREHEIGKKRGFLRLKPVLDLGKKKF